MKIVNCTPHDVVLRDAKTNENIESFASVGIIPRVSQENNFDGIFGAVEYGELENMPEPKADTMYIVSTIAFDAAKASGRNDVCFPTGKMFRDKDGRIEAVEFLATSKKYK